MAEHAVDLFGKKLEFRNRWFGAGEEVRRDGKIVSKKKLSLTAGSHDFDIQDESGCVRRIEVRIRSDGIFSFSFSFSVEIRVNGDLYTSFRMPFP